MDTAQDYPGLKDGEISTGVSPVWSREWQNSVVPPLRFDIRPVWCAGSELCQTAIPAVTPHPLTAGSTSLPNAFLVARKPVVASIAVSLNFCLAAFEVYTWQLGFRIGGCVEGKVVCPIGLWEPSSDTL